MCKSLPALDALGSRRTGILNNIRVRKEKIARDKVNQLNHYRFKRARDEYVWDGTVPTTDKRILDLETAAKDIIDADPGKVELWYLTSYRCVCPRDGAEPIRGKKYAEYTVPFSSLEFWR